MGFLPQELVNLIIDEIDDIPTLKASCLAGSILRGESQRRIFRSLCLNCTKPRRVTAACSLVTESPRIAAYITCLTILGLSELADVETFLRIFTSITNVRRCLIGGMSSMFFGHLRGTPLWPPLLNFLSNQPLHELRVVRVTPLSPTVALQLLAIAPVVSFRSVYVLNGEGSSTTDQDIDDPMPDLQQKLSRLRNLILENGTSDICDLAVLEAGTRNRGLLRLSFACLEDPRSRLVFAYANTLQHISFDTRGSNPPENVLLPPLPALRSVEFYLNFDGATNDRVLISTLLDCSPLLADVTLSVSEARHVNFHARLNDYSRLSALDAALGVHPARPTVRWRFGLDADRRNDSPAWRELVALLQSGMPQVHQQKRLLLETYEWQTNLQIVLNGYPHDL
ncbi:hypothetical protein B0H16DRAFT_204744 [Mycena metata]|uniref:Uncharacterized protein n=1 Tax=Mycena metata TaxID=1033252 RepID=A0AAD7HYE8_9AGAR|nr:hypothetical protein B0H16DRAFT_204744 [Mycena metata]